MIARELEKGHSVYSLILPSAMAAEALGRRYPVGTSTITRIWKLLP